MEMLSMLMSGYGGGGSGAGRSSEFGGPEQFWKKEEDALQSETDEERTLSVKKLPQFPETWTISYTLLSYDMCAISICNDNGMAVAGNQFKISKGRPSFSFYLASLTSAMADPEFPSQTGRPHKPSFILVAYRLGYMYDELSAALSTMGITSSLEGLRAALSSSRQHSTDYLGRNYGNGPKGWRINEKYFGVLCENCGTKANKLKKCGGCKRVQYCSVDCQKIDWRNAHKGFCGKDLYEKL